MNIGANIKKYRQKKDMTQEMLASIVGVTGQAVSKWECGESIPDGMLFIPIADALEVSLDRLCGYEKVYEYDAYTAIQNLIINLSESEQMEKVREICWQTQKALFSDNLKFEYTPDEMEKLKYMSAITNDYGFTIISNQHDLPFYSLFPNPKKGFGSIIKNAEHYHKIFGALGDEYVLKALFALYAKEFNYTFEKEVLAQECEIPEDKIDDVLNKLRLFGLREPTNYEIDSKPRTLYTIWQKYSIMSVLIMLHETVYNATSFHLQAWSRKTPFLEDKTT